MSNQPNNLEHMIPAKEAAAVLGCNFRTVKRLAERGELPAMRIGNRWMFLPSLLDKWRRKKLLSNCLGEAGWTGDHATHADL